MKRSGEKGCPWSLMSDDPIAELLMGTADYFSGFAGADRISEVTRSDKEFNIYCRQFALFYVALGLLLMQAHKKLMVLRQESKVFFKYLN